MISPRIAVHASSSLSCSASSSRVTGLGVPPLPAKSVLPLHSLIQSSRPQPGPSFLLPPERADLCAIGWNLLLLLPGPADIGVGGVTVSLLDARALVRVGEEEELIFLQPGLVGGLMADMENLTVEMLAGLLGGVA